MTPLETQRNRGRARTPSARRVLHAAFLAFVACVAMAVTTLARPASAYCRATTCGSSAGSSAEGSACETSTGNARCAGGGAALGLWWGTGCVGYSLDAGAGRNVTYEASNAAIRAAFATWTEHRCGTLPVDVDAQDTGPTTNAVVEYRAGGANKNVIVFRDDAWPHTPALAADNTTLTDPRSGELALTTLTFVASTGQILDADIEINSAEYDIRPIEAGAARSGAYDLQTVLTHEGGHFLGMGHSDEREAMMFARSVAADTPTRALGADDGAALCDAYPPREWNVASRLSPGAAARAGGACSPRKGLAQPAARAIPLEALRLSCAAGPTPTRAPRGAPALLALVLLGALLARRSRS